MRLFRDNFCIHECLCDIISPYLGCGKVPVYRACVRTLSGGCWHTLSDCRSVGGQSVSFPEEPGNETGCCVYPQVTVQSLPELPAAGLYSFN